MKYPSRIVVPKRTFNNFESIYINHGKPLFGRATHRVLFIVLVFPSIFRSDHNAMTVI